MACLAAAVVALDRAFSGKQSRINFKMPVLVAPSILSADFAYLGDALKKAEEGKADWIHVDVMDGQFVPNLTIGMPVVAGLRKYTKLPLDVHLMIVDPDRYLEDFAKAGADHIIVHVEACPHLQRTLSFIRGLGKKAGVAINPGTSPETIRYVLSDIDIVLAMTVNPGFGGQKFITGVLPKIRQIRSMFDDAGLYDVDISVDGGINDETGKLVVEAGANVLVAGNSVYGQKDVPAAIAKLKQSAASAEVSFASAQRSVKPS
jgi:ribulose-phosphate 3-epimerase